MISAKTALIDISADNSNSLGVKTEGMLLCGIQFPAAMTGTVLTFDFALDNSTWADVLETDGTAVSYSVSAGDIVYHHGSDWRQADADAESTSINMLGVAVQDGDSGNKVLIRGFVRLGAGHITDTSGDEGDPLYISTTSGHVQFAAPSGNNDIARVVGYCINESKDIIYFNPSTAWVEVNA